jgi:hypothetical protein
VARPAPVLAPAAQEFASELYDHRPGSVGFMQRIQRTAGNQAVLRWLSTAPALPGPPASVTIQRQVPPLGSPERAALLAARADVFGAYKRVAAVDIGKITHVPTRNDLRDRWTIIEFTWNNALAKRVDDPLRGQLLNTVAQDLERLVGEINQADKGQPTRNPKSQTSEEEEKAREEKADRGKAQPYRNRELDTAIDLLVVKVVSRIGSLEGAEILTKMFGSKTRRAGDQFPRITSRLREIYNATDQKNTKGFIKDDALGNMGAMTRGNGPGASVHVSPKALAGQISPNEFATELLHEGSHALDEPTSDYAYKNGGAHYYLPPEVAVENAANYEQVGIDMLSGVTATPATVERKRSLGDDRVGQALALMRSQASRAWIRANDLRSSAKRASEPGVSALMGGPAANDPLGITQELFDRLFQTMDIIHDYALSTLQGRVADDEHYSAIVIEGPTAQVPDRMTETRTASQIAMGIWRAVLPRLEGETPFTTDQLLDLITKIDTYDRAELRAKLQAYYGKFDAPPGPTRYEQQQDYRQARAGAIESAGGEF